MRIKGQKQKSKYSQFLGYYFEKGSEMLFLTDTCFWKHIQEIYDGITLDLRHIIKNYKWGITEEVKKELSHFELGNFFPIEECYIVPISEIELQSYQSKYNFFAEYDLADQTLMVASLRDQYLLLTDDRSLYRTSLSVNIKSMLLPHFLIFLLKNGDMNKNQIAKILKFWESIKRFKKGEIKSFNLQLQGL